MLREFVFCLTLFFIGSLTAQQRDSITFKNGIDNPSLLSTHHFGIFISRINSNFKYRPNKRPQLTFSQSSGNIHLPYGEISFQTSRDILNI